MKNMRNLLIAVTVITSLFSCTMEKRVYNNGYNIDWFASRHQAKSINQISVREAYRAATLASKVSSKVITNNSGTSSIIDLSIRSLSASVNEAPVVATSETTSHNSAMDHSAGSNSTDSHFQVKNNQPDAAPAQGSSGGKSQLVALILCIFLGVIGIHRFYLGYTTIGIIQLLTLGGCGIWALIDLIRIIIGDLKPMNGDYTDKL